MKISYSALSDFKTCPLKYKFKYVDYIKTPKSKEQLLGTWVHETLKMMHTPQVVPPPEREVLDFFMSRWNESVFNSHQEAEATLYQAVKMLKDYYAKNYPANFNVLTLETTFVAPFQHGSEIHLITGRIDRLDKLSDGSFEIIDYKTGRRMPPQQEVDRDPQLSIYNLGLINHWPSLFRDKKIPVYLSMYFLKHGEKLTSQRTEEQLAQTKEQILNEIATIQKGYQKPHGFQPRQNPLCDWCEYQARCPLWRHKFQKESPPDEAALKEALREYLAIKAGEQKNRQRLVTLQQVINNYCDAHNLERVFNEQGYVTRSIQKRTVYDPEKLRSFLEPAGLWPKVLSFDPKKIKQLIESLPYEVRQKIGKTSQEREFKIIKASLHK